MRVRSVAPGEVEIGLEVEPHHLNLVGTLHGGMIAAAADTAMGLAYRTVLEAGTSHVTTTLSVAFLAPGRVGEVLARGRVVKTGRRVGYAEGEVLDAEGTLLARATATFTVTPEATQ